RNTISLIYKQGRTTQKHSIIVLPCEHAVIVTMKQQAIKARILNNCEFRSLQTALWLTPLRGFLLPGGFKCTGFTWITINAWLIWRRCAASTETSFHWMLFMLASRH